MKKVWLAMFLLIGLNCPPVSSQSTPSQVDESFIFEIHGHVYDMSQMLKDEKDLRDWQARAIAIPREPVPPNSPQPPQKNYDGRMGYDPQELMRYNSEKARYERDLAQYKRDQPRYEQKVQAYEEWKDELATRKRNFERWGVAVLSGKVTQVLNDGLLVNSGNGLVFLKDYPQADSLVDGNPVTTFAIRQGRHRYTTVMGGVKTVPLYFAAQRVDPAKNTRIVEKFPIPDADTADTSK